MHGHLTSAVDNQTPRSTFSNMSLELVIVWSADLNPWPSLCLPFRTSRRRRPPHEFAGRIKSIIFYSQQERVYLMHY